MGEKRMDEGKIDVKEEKEIRGRRDGREEIKGWRDGREERWKRRKKRKKWEGGKR